VNDLYLLHGFTQPTAIVYMKRFYLFQPLIDHDPKEIAYERPHHINSMDLE